MSFGAVAASVAGAAVGGLMSKGGGSGGGEVSKAPWDPAIKPLQNTLITGPQLETYYQQTPFNQLQQAGYQNLYSDLDNFRNTMAPQAQAFNNRLMGTNYQRAPAGSELGGSMRQVDASQFLPPEQRGGGQYAYGQAGGSGGGQGGGLMAAMNGMQGLQRPTGGNAMGMLQGMGQGGQDMQQTKPMQTGLLSQPQQGMSVVAPNSQSYGLLNWTELNPFTATNGIPKTPSAPASTEEDDYARWIAQQNRYREDRIRNGDNGLGGGGS